MVFIKLCTFFVFVAPLLAFSTIYSDCQGGSLLSMCQETLESGFVSTENDKFHRVSNAHEYYTTGSCKITYWTSSDSVLKFDNTLAFTKALVEIERTCRSKGLSDQPLDLNLTDHSGIFVGYVEPYLNSPLVVQVNGL